MVMLKELPAKEPIHMRESIPRDMRAAAIDRFGGPDVIRLQSLPVPVPAPKQVLIELDTAGIGVWDPYIREGELEERIALFPKIIGNDGAGTVVAMGEMVERFRIGDRVYAYTTRGGFYAEYVAVSQFEVAPIPPSMKADEAGALGADGITALRGLEDELHLREGQKLMVFGASGGVGHIAVQLAKRIGAEVLAVASGADGVKLVRRLGADVAVDGRRDDVAGAARDFAPRGLDVALVLVAGNGLDAALRSVKPDGRVAHPNGVEPRPEVARETTWRGYDGAPSAEAFERLNHLIGSSSFHVELDRVYPLEDAAQAHRDLDQHQHHLGKLALKVRPS
jgi:NADPH2:quinone reductase